MTIHNENENQMEVARVEVGLNKDLDDDGKPRRRGTMWTCSAHIITAVIGSGVLSLPWCTAQLGWIFGAIALSLFAILTYFTSNLLADCYRSPDPVTGRRNYTYMDAVGNNLGEKMRMLCGITQYVNIVGYAISYTVTAGLSMYAIYKATCTKQKGDNAESCKVPQFHFMLLFGFFEIFLSQIPNFHKLSWLSTIAAIMSFCYATIGVVLSFQKIATGHTGKTTLLGVEIGPDLSVSDKVWRTFRAIGDIELAYSFSFILIEIQDTMRAPKENKQMKRANGLSVFTTSVFYLLCGCVGYAAYGNDAPGNMLADVREPLWLVNVANVCIAVHIIGAYQVFSQPLFATVETWSSKKWPTSKFISKEYPIKVPGVFEYKLNLFRILWRSSYVTLATLLGITIPFFNEIIALLGATGYWPLTVYFPIAMYIAQRKIKKYSSKWFGFQFINLFCLICAIAAASGSISGIIEHKKKEKANH